MKPRQKQTRNKPNPLLLANINHCKSSPSSSAVENLPASVGDVGLIPALERSLTWRRAWKPTPVFSPGESRGQRKEPGGRQSVGSQRRAERTERSTTMPVRPDTNEARHGKGQGRAGPILCCSCHSAVGAQRA